jgi:hypothetical protein
MFYPPNSQLSTEEFLDTETGGFTLSDSTKIGIAGSTVRLLSSANNTSYIGADWATPLWSNQNNLPPASGVIESQFNVYVSADYTATYFSTDSTFLNFETTTTSQYFHITETSNFTGVSNATGYTLETRVQVPITDNTSSVKLGHGMLVDDGTKRIEFYYVDSGVGIRDTTDFIPVSLQSSPQKIRFGFKQDDYYVLLEDGSAFAGIDKFTGTSISKKLQIGAFNTSSDTTSPQTIGKTLVDYIYQSSSGMYLDEAQIASGLYSTTDQWAITPEYTPRIGVTKYNAAYVVSELATGNGTTSIKTQYKSSVATDWTDQGSYVTITSVPNQEILLSSVPTAGDGTDKLRFYVKQVSADGTAEPPRIDRITVKSSSNKSKILLEPQWGSIDGGNTVAIKLDSTNNLRSEKSASTSTIGLYHFNSGSELVDSSTSNISASTAGLVQSGVLGVFNERIQLGTSAASAISNATSFLDIFIDVTGSVDSSGNTGSAAGVGFIGSGLEVVSNSNETIEFSSGTHYLDVTTGNPNGTAYNAQIVKTHSMSLGDGFAISNITSNVDGDKLLKFHLENAFGGIQVVHDHGSTSGTFELSNFDYKGIKEVELLITGFDNTETNKISFMSSHVLASDKAEFSVSNIQLHDLSTGLFHLATDASYDLGSNNWTIDFYANLLAYSLSNNGTILHTKGGGGNEIKLSVNNKGYPILLANSVSVTGNWPIPLNKDSLISIARRDSYLTVSVDGEINGLSRFSSIGAIDLNPGDLYVGSNTDTTNPTHSKIDELRIETSAIAPPSYAQSMSIVDPFFRSIYELPAYTGAGSRDDWKTISLLHFNELAGPVVDDAEFWGGVSNEAIVPHANRRLTTRGESGVIGLATQFRRSFLNNGTEIFGGMLVPFSTGMSTGTDQAVSVFFKFGGYRNLNNKSSIVRNISDTNNGYDVGVDTGGHIYVDIYQGSASPVSTYSHTSAYAATNTYRPCGVSIDPLNTSVNVWVAGTYTGHTLTGNAFAAVAGFHNYMSGVDRSGIEIGAGAVGSIDELTVIEGLVDSATYSNWSQIDSIKSLPQLDVYVGGTKLSTGRIISVHPRAAYMVMPEGTAGDTHVYVDFDSYKISTDRPYKYTNSFDRTILSSGIAMVACETKSPFRIASSVPDGSINLAMINTPDLLPENNVSTIDLSDMDAANISNHLHGKFSLQDQTLTGTQLIYTGQIDTKDIVISNRSVVGRELDAPYPLFYKYLVGRGRHYLHRPGVSVSDLDVIKSEIEIVNEVGTDMDISLYPYDIEVSSDDFYGNSLPSGNFAIILYTQLLSLSNRSVFVKYNASDSANSYKLVPGKREVINPIPIIQNGTGQDTYSAQINSSGVYNLYINTG